MKVLRGIGREMVSFSKVMMPIFGFIFVASILCVIIVLCGKIQNPIFGVPLVLLIFSILVFIVCPAGVYFMRRSMVT